MIHNQGILKKFADIRTSVGIKNLSAFKTRGKFTSEVTGLYHLSVSIDSTTAPASFSIYKSNTKLVAVYDDDSGRVQMCTVVVVVEMNVGDSIRVTADSNMYIYALQRSCITIAML